MTLDRLSSLHTRIAAGTLRDEAAVVRDMVAESRLAPAARAAIAARGAALVGRIRCGARPGLMEVFLAEYGLSTDEGIALMCLAEALLRVPDPPTMDALIEDKIAPGDWGRHLGHSSSSLVNASTWALMLTGRVLDDRPPGVSAHLRSLLKRLGEPVIRSATARAMREMGRQFVLGETIEAAMERARKLEHAGYGYSYDMLGEAARTAADAERYHRAYAAAIEAIGRAATGANPAANPGISIKLSALHPRYEVAQRDRVMNELVPRARELARMAACAGIGMNIDAEESDRLALSLEVVAEVMADPALEGWDGFGIVVQAYGPRARDVIDWIHALAEHQDRKVMVRLVKGAYWDTEIKRAQVSGLDGFPVFTRKAASDISFIACARKLLGLTDRIYPQFATHNAHSVAAVLHMAQEAGVPDTAWEFQRLHGMGERLHEIVRHENASRCRIYAPVGAHRDLLAYLVRRLLENGANSSFVNRIVDDSVPAETVAACPFAALGGATLPNPAIARGPALFRPVRENSRGFDLACAGDLAAIDLARAPHREACFDAAPLLAAQAEGAAPRRVRNPANLAETLGEVRDATPRDVETALALARPWQAPARERAAVLARAAQLYEERFGRMFALLAREAGKTLPDAVGELREAVDFLHYYGAGAGMLTHGPRGVIACISPWNFPLAIFTGQIAAALAAGNAVLAKPAEQTPLIAAAATALLHEAGVPRDALQLLPGAGARVGAALTADRRVAGVAFTGGTDTARLIQRSMARNLAPGAPLVAETGGLNAMIVDSTALHEQAVRDVLASAFQSAGQRCSALRCLYVQREVVEGFREMLLGAMDELRLGDPWELSTDVGPLIDASATEDIGAYLARARSEGRLAHMLPAAAAAGYFLGPAVVEVGGIEALGREVFGPVLHLATFDAARLDDVLDAINRTGYGLTFGLHSRIDDRVQRVVERLRVGNIYVNRNQIGAVVGSQPFGGEGLSGTGPKAGGPHYLPRFTAASRPDGSTTADRNKPIAGTPLAPVRITDMPGPTGESNRLMEHARGPIVCLGPGTLARAQARAVRTLGGVAIEAPDSDPAAAIEAVETPGGVLWWGDPATGQALARTLAERPGPIVPLLTEAPDAGHVLLERHLCIDTTAAGGNAALLAKADA